MNWIDHETYIDILAPEEFNFAECMVFLGRSDQEVLHQIIDGYLYKLIQVADEMILFRISSNAHTLQVEFPRSTPSLSVRQEVAAYIWEWFDLDKDLEGFYEMAGEDRVLQPITEKHYGLRMICIPDLFEALTWAIMGQQINLTFAYTLKKRFVEHFGEGLIYEGNNFWLFPDFKKIASLDVDDLRELQFTGRKAEYIIEIAKAMANGEFTKETFLQKQAYQDIQKSFMAIRGIGAWTADYVMMKCLQHASAFPISDVGLHNALKLQLRLERKPTIEEIKDMARNWKGWEAYATFYLWRTLYEL